MSLTPIRFDNEQVQFLAPTWDELNELAFEVAKNIKADQKPIDRIITLAKGGWPLTRSLVDFLGVKEVASIGAKFYKGVNQRLEKPEIYQQLPVDVKGERLLLFDDVADTGDSLLFVKDYLHSLGIEGITTATLFYKQHSKITPDYFGMETDTWIIFPYEVQESIKILRTKWQKEGISEAGIKSRLPQLGFKPDWVEYFYNYLVKESCPANQDNRQQVRAAIIN